MKWRELIVHMGTMKHYFIAAAATFFIGVYLGYADSQQFQFILEAQKEQLTGVFGEIMAKEHVQWRLLAFIFFNNIWVSLFMMYTGVLFAVIPLFSLISNGLMMGYLAQQSAHAEGWGSFLLAVLPHGVIELPALFLACAYGIRFGALTVKGFIFLLSPSRRVANSKNFIQQLKLSLPLALLLGVLFLTAAIIESMITFRLVN